MKELFQLRDYIKINSSDFKKEIAIQSLRFEKPSYDFRYWEKNIKTKDADLFKKWFEGKTLRIDSNELTVEFSKELAGNSDEKIRLYEYIFSDDGIKNHVLPLPKDIYDLINIDVQIVPGSATYNFKGRTIVIRFSTLIKIHGNYTAKAKYDLKQGISCTNTRDFDSFSAIYQVLSNSDGIEFFDGENGRYVIEKSMDEDICRRKFQLMYRSALEVTLPNLLRIAYIFAPGYAPKKASNFLSEKTRNAFGFINHDFDAGFIGFHFFGEPRPRHSFFRAEKYSYFDFKVHPQTFTAKEYASNLKKLGEYFDKCEIEVAKAIEDTNGLIETKDPRFGTVLETKKLTSNRKITFGDDSCYAILLLSKHDFHDNGSQMLEEIRSMNQIIHGVQKFLEKEIVPSADSHGDFISEYAFKKITLDPILYSDDAAWEFSRYAKTLI